MTFYADRLTYIYDYPCYDIEVARVMDEENDSFKGFHIKVFNRHSSHFLHAWVTSKETVEKNICRMVHSLDVHASTRE